MNIFSLPIVEIAISVIISWALFSIFCSMIHESMAQIKSERGRFFKSQLQKQLFDAPNQINWASLLYTHSSVDLLSRAYNKPASSISPKIFAEGIVETVANSHLAHGKRSNTEYKSLPQVTYKNKLLNDFAHAVHVLLPSDVISLLKSSLTKAEVKAGFNASSSGEVQTGSKEDLVYTYLIEEVSEWYKQYCERNIIWYRKKTKQRLFFLGLVLSIVLNVDSVQLFSYYSNNSQARSQLIKFYADNKTYLENAAQKFNPIDTVRYAGNAEQAISQSEEFGHKADSLIAANSIPIGSKYLLANTSGRGFGENIFLKIIGFLISAFAASVGAPFWFEILRKAIPVKK